jgi:hypothetical protein
VLSQESIEDRRGNLRTVSWYPDLDCSEMDESCAVDSSTLVAGSKASEVLQAIEASFDAIAPLLDHPIMREQRLFKIRLISRG